jgi:hypothetical protein
VNQLAGLTRQLEAAFQLADALCLTTRYYEAHRAYWDASDDIRSRLALAMSGAVTLADVMGRPKRATPAPVLTALLARAESFISGFEDDPQQKGVARLLRELRAAVTEGISAYAHEKVFEVTLAGFDGGTDVTDDRVKWVVATSPEQIALHYPGANVTHIGYVGHKAPGLMEVPLDAIDAILLTHPVTT